MQERKTIYIAGPMTGKAEFNYPRFRRFAKLLRDDGWKVISPVEISEDLGLPPEILANDSQRMQELVCAELTCVKDCDSILMLTGWEKSKGARIELLVALTHGLEVIQERDYVGRGAGYSTRKEA